MTTDDKSTQTETPETPAEATEPTETRDKPQDDQLGDGGQKALQAERQKRREAERQAAEAREKSASLEAAELRREVASEKGLTAEQAQFLDGEDREALEARADALLAAFPARRGEPPRRQPRSGATGETEPADPGAIADEVMKSW
jgi:hypothetical protein